MAIACFDTTSLLFSRNTGWALTFVSKPLFFNRFAISSDKLVTIIEYGSLIILDHTTVLDLELVLDVEEKVKQLIYDLALLSQRILFIKQNELLRRTRWRHPKR